jgi:UPF0755 protein
LRQLLNYFLAAVVLVLLALGSYLYWFSITRLSPQEIIYVVEPGVTLRAFSQKLHDQGVLPDAHSLVWLAYLKGQERHLKTGEYRFRKGITPLQLLEQVVSGRVVEYPLTIIEGWTFKQVMETLAKAPRLTHTLQGLQPHQIMASLGYPGMHPEGRFYPDTYYYSAGMSDLIILQRAFQKMDTLLQTEWAQRDTSVPLKNADEALILASIVEKETGRADERPMIAGVFIQRLRIGMRLQTDPTIIYGMGDQYRGNIGLKDLRARSPYNTYIIKGLPPTPIAMPSGAALRAVMNPADTKALYFVARGDGGHVFSENLQDHNQAVEKYQLNSGSAKKPAPAAAPAARPTPAPRAKILKPSTP